MSDILLAIGMLGILGLFVLVYQDQRRNKETLMELQKEISKLPYKLEPAPETKQEEHVTEYEVNEDIYNQMMSEWMGINPKEFKKEGDVNGNSKPQ